MAAIVISMAMTEVARGCTKYGSKWYYGYYVWRERGADGCDVTTRE